MNAFDFVVTIALGSMLSATVLDKDLPLIEGLIGIFMLVMLQFVITWLSVRIPLVDRLIKAEPALLLQKGRMDRRRMKHERITEDEVRAALRQGHWDDVADVESVRLETNGKLTVVYRRR